MSSFDKLRMTMKLSFDKLRMSALGFKPKIVEGVTDSN